MKKTLQTLFILLVGTAAALAQEPATQWGPPATFEKEKGDFDKIIGTNEEGTYVLRKANSQVLHKLIYLEKVDNSGKVLFTKEITPPWDNNETLAYNEIFMVNSKLR